MKHPSSSHAASRIIGAARLSLLVAPAAAILGGCGGLPPQRLELHDSKSRDGDVIASFRPEAWKRRDGRGPGRGFEAGYQQDSNTGTQALAAGESLSFRGSSGTTNTITGPDLLLQESKLIAWHFGFTDRFYLGPLELDIAAGGMKLEFEYALRPQSGTIGRQAFAREFTWPFGAITPRWRLNRYMALEARLAVAAQVGDEDEHRRLDSALVLTPLPQVSLRLGYSHRRTRVEVFNDPVFFKNTTVTVRGRGPTAGLRIDF